MKLTPKRLYFVLAGLLGIAFAVLLLGAYAATMILQTRAQSVRDARLEVMVLEEKQRQLTKARADVKKYQGLADIARHIVPQDKDQAQTVREIVNIAEQNGIKLGAITFPTSSLGDKKAQFSQLTPVTGLSGVLSLEITVQSDSSSPATFPNFLAFLDALEHNRRTALVTGISLTPDSASANRLSFTLTLNEYVKP